MNYYSVPQLDNTGLVRTVYTPKEYGRWKHNEEGALENYTALGNLLGITPKDMIRPSQTHTTVVRVVNQFHAGTGVVCAPLEGDCDGLITNTPGLFLCTREADCVPVYLLDPVHKAVGMIHSGWRGSAAGICEVALKEMEKNFSTRPRDVLAATGPCICKNCYEVGEDLLEPFSRYFSQEEINILFQRKNPDKYLLDVRKAVELCLLRYGVQPSNLFSVPVCTFENPEFSSYRRDKSYDSHMLTGIMLQKSN